MKIRIQSAVPLLSDLLVEELGKQPDISVSIENKLCTRSRLRFGEDISNEQVSFLRKTLHPIVMKEYLPDSSLPVDGVVVELGGEVPLEAWKVDILTDSPGMLNKLRGELGKGLGFQIGTTDVGVIEKNLLISKGSFSFAWQALLWYLCRKGLEVEEQPWEEEDAYLGMARDLGLPNICPDYQIRLQVRDPLESRRPFRERMNILLGTDDVDAVQPLRKQLLRAGYSSVKIFRMDEDDIRNNPVGFASPWFDCGQAPEEAMEIRRLLSAYLRSEGIDLERYPVRCLRDVHTLPDVFLFVPVKACRAQSKRPYSGAFPERFNILIQTDDQSACEPLKAALNEAGFVEIAFGDLDAEDRVEGFGIGCHHGVMPQDIYGLLKHQLLRFKAALGAPWELDVALADTYSNDEDVILRVPCKGAGDGSLLARIKSPEHCECTVYCEEDLPWRDVIVSLKRMNFKNGMSVAKPKNRLRGLGYIEFAGVQRGLLQAVIKNIQEKEPLEFKTINNAFGSREIAIYLPKRTREPLLGLVPIARG